MDSQVDQIKAQLDKEIRKNEIAQSVSLEIGKVSPLKDKLNHILEILEQSYSLKHTMLLFPDKDQQKLTVYASRGFDQSGIGAETPFGQGIIGMVAKKKKKIRIAGIPKYRQYAYTAARKQGMADDAVKLPGLPNVDSQLAIPLLANNELIAVLSIESSDHNFFSKEDEFFLQSLSQQMALSIQNAIIIDQLEEKVHQRTQEIERQKAELERLNATKDRFFSIIGHDLKSPVSSLKVATDLIQYHSRKGDIEKLTEVGFKISTAVNNVNQLLDNLLNWAMNQRNMLKCESTKINLKEIFERVEKIFKESITAKNLVIDNQLTDECLIFSDRNMTLSVLRNVLSNAIKFSHKKGTITVRNQSTGNETMVTITDQGVGMSPDKVHVLFHLKEKKSTLGTNREKGTGLGMVLVKDFMEMNNGSVTIESQPNQGTKVTLCFRTANS
ncbi:MAG TPA: GAF domain-containing sensor histidine kinase [Draconibacterium sp.]|nr:GAF domain-containing sensor histidine kinase [Draconibacterium sp.]